MFMRSEQRDKRHVKILFALLLFAIILLSGCQRSSHEVTLNSKPTGKIRHILILNAVKVHFTIEGSNPFSEADIHEIFIVTPK